MDTGRASPRRPRPTAFVQDFVDVDRPLDAVASRFSDSTWLEPIAAAAGGDGESTLVRLGPAKSDWLARDVIIRLGPPNRRGDGVVVPLRWEAAQLRPLFPVLDGDLELASIGDGRCRLVLHASYRAPLDGVGHLLDAAVLHRVAESTVRSFMRRLAESIERGARTDDASSA